MNIVGIGGEPATGKSHLMNAIIARLQGPRKEMRYNKTMCWYEYPESKACVIGIYPEGETFGGTDRLSMAVQPVAIRWLPLARSKYIDWTIFFEGDRLFTGTFLAECRKYAELCTFIILTASDSTKKLRRFARTDTKPPEWLQGRVTKYQKIYRGDKTIVLFSHEDGKDTEAIVGHLFKGLGIDRTTEPTASTVQS